MGVGRERGGVCVWGGGGLSLSDRVRQREEWGVRRGGGGGSPRAVE